MLDIHYALHAWDKLTSWQTRRGLEKIGLADVADMLAEVDRLIDDQK